MAATKAELFERIRHDSWREGLSVRALAHKYGGAPAAGAGGADACRAGARLAGADPRSPSASPALADLRGLPSFRSFALAAQRFMQAIELDRKHGWTGEPVVAVAYAGLGAIRVWQMRLEEAEALLDQAERALRAR